MPSLMWFAMEAMMLNEVRDVIEELVMETPDDDSPKSQRLRLDKKVTVLMIMATLTGITIAIGSFVNITTRISTVEVTQEKLEQRVNNIESTLKSDLTYIRSKLDTILYKIIDEKN